MLLQILGLSPSGTRGVLFQHDTSLVVFSYLIAVCGSYASLEMIERWQNARGAKASYWQLASAVALGGSIWSTHFVAMLAVKIELPLTYGPGLTALSLLIAIGV